jgi:hypothetical protein
LDWEKRQEFLPQIFTDDHRLNFRVRKETARNLDADCADFILGTGAADYFLQRYKKGFDRAGLG